MKTALLVINSEGEKLARQVQKSLPAADIFFPAEEKRKTGKSINSTVEEIFGRYDGLVFFAALGIVVRCIGPLSKSKIRDPAVVCVDTAGRYSISVLCGHEGGANKLAFDIASIVDAQPVITTGTEAHKNIILGIGCRREISAQTIKGAIEQVLEEEHISSDKIRLAATVDRKKNEEGLRQACAQMGIPLIFVASESLKNFQGTASPSQVVKKHLGIWGVCEPCALIAGRRTQLLSKKSILNGVTIALAKEN